MTYARLLEANNAIQTLGDDTYWLCVTRTVQESKLFPVPSYMLLSYRCCYYRYPEVLRKVEAKMSAEEVGDRARAMVAGYAQAGFGKIHLDASMTCADDGGLDEATMADRTK